MALTVACVCVGDKYGPEHVSRLYCQVCEHISGPFIFQPIWQSPWPGWWSKLSLFEPDRFAGRVLYLDLDVTVVGPLLDLATVTAPFVICRDFLTLGFNSSVLCWTAGKADHIHAAFAADPAGIMARLHGDQDFIAEQMPDADTFPHAWVQSYKADVLTRGQHQDCRVIVYHGRPKPWEVEG